MTPFIHKNLAYIIFPAIAFTLSLILTRVCISIMPKLGFMDVPGGRHIHKKITPKGGGIAVILAFIATWLLFLFSPWNYFIGKMSLQFLGKVSIPAVILILVGIIDDKYAIKARYKLLGQIIAGAACCYAGIRFSSIFHFQLPLFWSYIVTTFWIVGFINAFNLIDGLDGLAAGLGLVSCVCMSAIFIFEHAPLNTVIILSLAASCLGFLKYNFHPARIFMGDTGSMFIGFMLAVIGIESSAKIATFSSVLVPLLAAGVPVFDVFLAIWRRLSRRILQGQVIPEESSDGCSSDKIMSGDREHLHHRLLDRHESQRKTTIIMYGISLVLGVLAVSLVLFKDKVQGLAFIIILGAFVTAIRYLATVELWNSTKVIVNGIHNPKKGLLVAMSHPFFDIFILVSSFIFSYCLFHSFTYSAKTVSAIALLSFYNILPVVFLLHIGRTYRRFWVRASATTYIKLAEMLLLGHITNFIIQYPINKAAIKDLKIFFAQFLIYLLLSSALILAERMSLRYLRSAYLKNLYLKNHLKDSIPRALVYGGGLRCRFFLTERFNSIEDDPIDIIGIIDDQATIRGQYVYGFKVIGNIDDLEKLYKKTPFNRFIISSRQINKEKRETAKKFCKKYDIQLTELIFQENVL